MIKRFEFNDKSRSFIALPPTDDKKCGKEGAISEGFFLQKRVTLMVDGKPITLNRGSVIDFLNAQNKGVDLKKGMWGLRSLPFIPERGATNVEIQEAFDKIFPKPLTETENKIFIVLAEIVTLRAQEIKDYIPTPITTNDNGRRVTRIPPCNKQLNLTKQKINDAILAKLFAENLKDLKQFTEINLYENQLTKIPSAIGELTSLRTLQLSRNQLTKLPNEISNCSALNSLGISENQLTRLPKLPTQLRFFHADTAIQKRYPSLEDF
jgi:hypothetical protein